MLWVGRLDHMVIVRGLLRAVVGHFCRKVVQMEEVHRRCLDTVYRYSLRGFGIGRKGGGVVGWKKILEGPRSLSVGRLL
jgi:hypothetical protein